MDVRCSICGRILKSAESQALGYGKTCASRHGQGKKKAPLITDPNIPRLRECNERLKQLRGDPGNRPLFPEYDDEFIKQAEKDKNECIAAIRKNQIKLVK